MEVINNPKRKMLLISGGVILSVVLVSLVVYFATKKSSISSSLTLTTPPTPMQLLQSKINDLVSGKTAINNLTVLNTINVNNNNPNDTFTLKLITNSDRNGIAFSLFGVDAPGNIIGVKAPLTATIPSPLPTTYTLSSPITLTGSQPEPTIDTLQRQLNLITLGTTKLNNLKVTGSLTLISYDTGYPVILNNQSGTAGSDKLGTCVMFANKDFINGYIGISAVYPTNKYDQLRINVNSESLTRPIRPTPIPTPPPMGVLKNETAIDSLNKQFDDIINGNTPINNLSVLGDLTVTGTTDTLLFLKKSSNAATTDPTLLINFNNYTDASGVGGDFGFWSFFGSANSGGLSAARTITV